MIYLKYDPFMLLRTNFVYRQDELASHDVVYNTIDFLQNTSTRYGISHIIVQTRECLCEFKAKSMLYPKFAFYSTLCHFVQR